MTSFGAALWKKPAAKRFVLHTIGLVLACVALSFVFGGLVVGGPTLNGFGFFAYGGLGYIAIVMALFFFVYAREKLVRFSTVPRVNWWFVALGLVFAALFAFGINAVNADPSLVDQKLTIGVPLHLAFIATFAFLALGAYGYAFFKSFFRTFLRELLICAGVGLVFYAAMRVVWLSWPYLSWGVGKVVYAMLYVFPGDPVIAGPQVIRVGDFAVLIGEACSGVFSIFLFSCLFLLIVALDWKKLRHGRAAIMFGLTMVGLFLVNVLRVYLIILVGYFYNPEFAVNLFHSYVGMILFMAYFVAWLHYGYDWMRK
jgi:exosortase/archaeosortase family protein